MNFFTKGLENLAPTKIRCKIFQDLATVANCESLGEANKIHLSQAIFDQLKNSKFDNGRRKFELEEDTSKASSKRFVIRRV